MSRDRVLQGLLDRLMAMGTELLGWAHWSECSLVQRRHWAPKDAYDKANDDSTAKAPEVRNRDFQMRVGMTRSGLLLRTSGSARKGR
jgi:hypothetical protein